MKMKYRKRIALLLTAGLTAALLQGCMTHVPMPVLPADLSTPAEETPVPTEETPEETPVPTTEPTPEPTPVPTPVPTVEPGVYPEQVGLYAPIDNYRALMTTLDVTMRDDREIDCFEFFPTQEGRLSNNRFSTVFNPLWEACKAKDEMKIGYMLDIKLKNGLDYSHTILSPDDGLMFKNYVEAYLYDDIHQTPGEKYGRLTESEMKDNTLCTSIKLICGEWCNEIEQIGLTGFIYTDPTADFDPVNHNYTGKLSYQITIKPKA